MADNAEEFLIKLNEQISGPAKVATSAVAQLEAQIAKQASVVSGYEAQLAAAAQKLQMLGEGDARGAVNVASFRRQQQAVAALQQKVDDARASMSNLAGATGIAAQVDALKAETAAATAAAAAEKKRAAALKEAASVQAKFDKESRASGENAATTWNANVAKHASALGKQVTGQKSAGAAAKAVSVNLEEMGGKLVQLGGPLGTTGGKAAQLGGALQTLGRVGVAGTVIGITVAVIALAAALVYAVAAATKFAISMADGVRNQKLQLESLAANYKALANIAQVAPKVAAATGLAVDEVQKLAEQLAKAKLPAKHLEAALKAMATAQAGGANAEFLEKLQKALIATGKIPPELAEQFAKFQAIAGKKMLSLDAQSAKFKSNVSGLFSGLKLDGFLAGLAKIVALFDSSTAAGRGLKAIIEHIFQPLIDGATRAIPMVIRAFLTIEVVVLEVMIALKKLEKALDLKPPMIATGPFVSSLQEIGSGANIAAAALNSLQGAMTATGAAAGTASTGVATSAAKMGSAWQAAKAQVNAQVNATQATAAAAGTGAMTGVGGDMMAGLANGITANAGAVMAAMQAAVGGAVDAAKSQLQLGSPSKLFHKFGRWSMQGYAGGTEEERPNVERAVSAAVAPSFGGAGGQPRGAAGGAGGATAPHFEFNNCTFGDGLDASKLEVMMIPIFQRSALALEGE